MVVARCGIISSVGFFFLALQCGAGRALRGVRVRVFGFVFKYTMIGCVLGRGSGTPHVGMLDVWRRSRLAMGNRRGSNYSPTL